MDVDRSILPLWKTLAWNMLGDVTRLQPERTLLVCLHPLMNGVQ